MPLENESQWEVSDRLYYAYKTERGVYLYASPDRRWVELHDLAAPIVALRLRERTVSDPPAVDARKSGMPDYWGWLAAGEDRYSMVWPSKIQLDMCFSYGMRAAEDYGNGRGVSLVVEEVENKCRAVR